MIRLVAGRGPSSTPVAARPRRRRRLALVDLDPPYRSPRLRHRFADRSALALSRSSMSMPLRFSRREPLYQPLYREPFTVFSYTPLYYALSATLPLHFPPFFLAFALSLSALSLLHHPPLLLPDYSSFLYPCAFLFSSSLFCSFLLPSHTIYLPLPLTHSFSFLCLSPPSLLSLTSPSLFHFFSSSLLCSLSFLTKQLLSSPTSALLSLSVSAILSNPYCSSLSPYLSSPLPGWRRSYDTGVRSQHRHRER